MDFVGIGFNEVIIVLVIAFLVVGPRRLPEVARTLGQAARKLRLATTELTRALNEEIEREAGEAKDDVRGIANQIVSDYKSLASDAITNVDPVTPSSPPTDTTKDDTDTTIPESEQEGT